MKIKDAGNAESARRIFGSHMTSTDIFDEYIMPRIEGRIKDHIWVDMFAGEGNLILPILKRIPPPERKDFFTRNMFLFDIQESMVKKSIENAVSYGIPEPVARQNIMVMDTLRNFPAFIMEKEKPVYHITNPPYLYIGYIAKHRENSYQMEYFSGQNRGLQDLYQLALMNDSRNNIRNMAYIVPSNFLFGHSVSNMIRKSIFKDYRINEAVIFEKKIFENTGTNVTICFFERNELPTGAFKFNAIKINSVAKKREYLLSEIDGYRAGSGFDHYVQSGRKSGITVEFYLKKHDIDENFGENRIVLVDSKDYRNRGYTKREFFVNDMMYRKIMSNPLFIRTVDTGRPGGKAGLYSIRKIFNADGIYVDGNTYRTNPIQVFINPVLSDVESNRLMITFNDTLNMIRDETDSEFMTTYRYSNSSYTRKYLGLSQARRLIETINPFTD